MMSDTIPNPSGTVKRRQVMGRGAKRTRRSRRLWIGAILLVQALILSAGWIFTLMEVRSRVASKFQDQILRANVATVEAISKKLAAEIPGRVDYGSKAWEEAQSIIETLHLPAEGFACLVDDDGKLLCHPEIRRDPSLHALNLSDELLRTDSSGPTPIKDLATSGIATGKVTFNALQTHYVATTYLPGLHARLLVHQPEDGLLSAGETVTSGLLWFSVAIGAAVLLSTGGISALLMRRHDRQLEAINGGLEDEVARRLDASLRTRDALITGLASLADSRDNDTGTHLERIAEYAVLLANAIRPSFPEIDDAWIATLRVASSMHDIGKVGIPDSVLLKPGPLTPEERRIMSRHPHIGADTLIRVHDTMGPDPLVDASIRIALFHHERWDGKGYPNGISGAEIPLDARIVALVDVYDALTSQRVYKAAKPHAEAVQIIRDSAGSQFDPAIVALFLEIAPAFDRVRASLQANEEVKKRDRTRQPETATTQNATT